ncbi:CotH kinase family protein [bacterium]|nr:CotH kinase family protein [bacterium]
MLVLIFCLFLASQTSAQVVFNEIQSSNSKIADENGNFPDWIELYNASNFSVNLAGYGLSDDSTDAFKWVFPNSATLSPQSYLLVFASGNTNTFPNHWETVINWGNLWKYKPGNSEPPTNWKEINFDETTWQTGKTGIGYGDSDDSTLVSQTTSLYLRKTFTVDDVSNILSGIFQVDYDDGFVAYLNGTEIARANLVGIPPAFNETASDHEAQIYQGGLPQVFKIQNIASLLEQGTNVLAIQVHNSNPSSSDLTIIPFLTLGMQTPPQNPNGVPAILEFSLPKFHANFSISSQGETLTLTNPSSQTVDQIVLGAVPPDFSFGRFPDGAGSWFFFNEPTPKNSNATQGFSGITEKPQFSTESGFFTNSFVLQLSTNSPNQTIRYTLDSSEPTENSTLYTNPIIISQTKIVRAKTFQAGFLSEKATTKSYLFNVNSSLPIVSLSTDSLNLWDFQSGIYAMGPNADPNFPHFGANFWGDWEKPVHVDFLETNGNLALAFDGGVKIVGGFSRGNAQKSFGIFARNEYGDPSINYQLFPELPITEFESFILRNSGNDWNTTMFRDAFMQSLVYDTNIDCQAYRPSVVYLNGKYWGILNIREKLNEPYVENHFKIDADSVYFLELPDGTSVSGEGSLVYNQMFNFISNNDLSIPANYDSVTKMIDIPNLIDYQIAQIYFDNTDWPGNNSKCWRKKADGGKWRWMLYDTDFGYGLFDENRYTYNTLAFATETNGGSWPNPSWSTLILRKLLENSEFRNDFIHTFCYLLSTNFNPINVLPKLNEIKTGIENEIPNHLFRWTGSASASNWNYEISKMSNFANQRPTYVKNHIATKFDLTNGTAFLTLNVFPNPQAGKIEIGTKEIKNFPLNAEFFKNVPIKLTATPNKGFHFVGWTGLVLNDSLTINLSLNGNLVKYAVFAADTVYANDEILINEINYNSSPTFDTKDWVELHNQSNSNIDVSGWIFKDSDSLHVFELPQGTILNSGSYVVLCEDTTAFKSLFPTVTNFLGNFDFGLSGNGELIRLYDQNGNLVDSLVYDDEAPWQTAPDGTGSTLQLKNPAFDNSLAENWGASASFGTPGSFNDNFLSVAENGLQVPAKFSLSQNYPNPFNPTTKISFTLPKTAKVRLEIFNVLGQSVKTLLNETKKAGFYTLDFNAQNFASGIYFYRLESGSFSQTKKMLLIK